MILGTGIDVVRISRVSRLITDHAGHLDRVFTERERAFCERGPARHRAARYAGIFAAKEAVMKALATGWRSDVGFADIETRDPEAPGEAVLHGGVRNVADDRGIDRMLLSTASIADTALAAAVAARRRR
jgi:holo-[acyl-carrier protein] synthase